MYLLGAAKGVAAKAANNLMNKYKGLNIVGTYSPPFGFEKDKAELKKIESQTSATENLMELKQILVLLAEIETKLAVNDPNAIKAGISEDIVILNEQIKNLK